MAQTKGGVKPATTGGDWEEIQPFTQPISLEVGQEIIAQYLGGNEVEVPAKKDEDGAFDKDGKIVRMAMLHEFQNEDETEPFGVWGSAVLDKRLAEIPSGSRVRVLYDGKQELDGGRTARRYRVWVDKSAKF